MRNHRHLTVVMLFSIGYLISPIVYIAWIMNRLAAGAFPPQSDSISIPIAGFLFFWFLGLVFMFVVGFVLAVKTSVMEPDADGLQKLFSEQMDTDYVETLSRAMRNA